VPASLSEKTEKRRLTFLSNVVAYPCRHSPRGSASWLSKAFQHQAT
jgi:hypothetical protein